MASVKSDLFSCSRRRTGSVRPLLAQACALGLPCQRIKKRGYAMGDLVDLDTRRPAGGHARLRADLMALILRLDDETLLLVDAFVGGMLERNRCDMPNHVDVRGLKVRQGTQKKGDEIRVRHLRRKS